MKARTLNMVYFGALVTGIAFKFWLIQSEEIFGTWAEYDELWYLRAASHWYWNAAYHWNTFLRTPGYPLFIAVIHCFGIPLRIGIELFQAGGYLLVAHALRRLHCPRPVCFIAFALVLFNPCSYQLNNTAMSDTCYAGALTWLAGALILNLAHPTYRSALLAGVSFALAWITREETFLLLPIILIFFGAVIWREWSGLRALAPTARRSVRHAIVFLIISIGLIAATYCVNYRSFGSFSNSEMTSPSFEAAYRALIRINPPHLVRYVPVTHDAMVMAYSASPTFARLQTLLEGPVADGWKKLTARELHCCEGEIGGAWLRFALRYVADQAGVHSDPATARRFYTQVARELNQSMDEQRLPSRHVFSTFFDPGSLAFANELPRSFGRVASVFLARYSMSTAREDEILPAHEARLYNEICLRRSYLTHTASIILRFSSLNKQDPITSVAYEIERPSLLPWAKRTVQNSDAMISPGQAAFEVTLYTYTPGPPLGKLTFTSMSGKRTTIPARWIVNQSNSRSSSTLPVQITAVNYSSSFNSRSLAIENWIGRNYRKLLVVLLGTGTIGAILCILRFRSLAPAMAGGIAILIVAAVARVAVLTYMDANYYDARDPRFTFPVMSLWWTGLILASYAGYNCAIQQLQRRRSGFGESLQSEHEERE